jgi:uncharacterized protein YkwD
MRELLLLFVLPLLSNITWIAQGPLMAELPAPPLAAVQAPAPVAAPKAVQTQVAEPASPSQPVEGFAQEIEQMIFDKTNAERIANGLHAVSPDAALTAIARGHSKDMALNDYFDHSDKNGCNSVCRAQAANYAYRTLGENIFLMSGLENLSAEDAAATITQGWMGSPGHRANILQKAYTLSGVGVYVKGTKLYATTMFSQPR